MIEKIIRYGLLVYSVYAIKKITLKYEETTSSNKNKRTFEVKVEK